MQMRNSRPRFWAHLRVVAIICATAVVAQAADTLPAGWEWPKSADSPRLRDSILNGGYTPEELRNIRVVLEFVGATGRGGNPKWWAQEYKSQGGGFPQLEAIYGSGDWGETKIYDRSYRVEDILAKKDRVWVTWMIQGHHTEKLFGFAPSGELLRVRESALLRLRDGRIAELKFQADEMALYLQAGGEAKLPK